MALGRITKDFDIKTIFKTHTQECSMKLGKEFIETYVVFGDNTVTVEIPFISNQNAEGFLQAIGKCQTLANLKGNFTILATSAVIVGFNYDFADHETKEYIQSILEVFSGMIMMHYYNQRDKEEIMQIQLAMAA